MLHKLSQKFMELEKRFQLFDLEYEEIPIWWFLRHPLFSIFYQKQAKVDFSVNRASSLSIKRVLPLLNKNFLPPQFQEHPILALSTSSARRAKWEGKDFDIFFDFLCWSEFKNQYAILETPDRMPHSTKPFSPCIYSGDYYLLKANLARRGFSFLSQFSFSKKLEEISKKLKESFFSLSASCSKNEILSLVYSEVFFAKTAIQYAHHALEKINPKILFLQSSSSGSRIAFQIAAKQRKIPIIEVQHGLIAENSLFYSHGFHRNLTPWDPVPDEIFVYGNYFKSVLEKTAVFGKIPKTVFGNPFLEKISTASFQETKHPLKRILIATIPDFSVFFLEVIKELIHHCPNYEIWIKPHPFEYDRAPFFYKEVISEKNVTLLPRTKSLYETLPQVEFFVSVGSASHLEAMAMGIKNIVLAHEEFEEYLTFLTSQGVPLCSSLKELFSTLKNYPMQKSSTDFFKKEVLASHQNFPLQWQEKIRNLLKK